MADSVSLAGPMQPSRYRIAGPAPDRDKLISLVRMAVSRVSSFRTNRKLLGSLTRMITHGVGSERSQANPRFTYIDQRPCEGLCSTALVIYALQCLSLSPGRSGSIFKLIVCRLQRHEQMTKHISAEQPDSINVAVSKKDGIRDQLNLNHSS